MMRQQRWRLCLATFLAVSTPGAFAHDPGLSALDVRVGSEDVTAVVSFDSSDVVILTGGGSTDSIAFFRSWTREAVQILVDGFPLDANVEAAAADETGAVHVTLRVRLRRGSFLSVRSTIAERAGRAHRTLITVSDEQGRRLVERLADLTHPQVDLSLQSLAANSSAAAGWFVAGAADSLTGYDYALLLVSLLMAGRWVFERRFRHGHRVRALCSNWSGRVPWR
jgi:hypothetical protein